MYPKETINYNSLSQELAARTFRLRYIERMNSSMQDKIARTYPYLEHLRKQPSTILSIGAGSGQLEIALAQLLPQATIISLDASYPMLETIQHQLETENQPSFSDDLTGSKDLKERLFMLQSQAEQLPFPENSLDAIICSSVIHEIASFGYQFEWSEGIQHFFMALARALKPGGRLLIKDFVQPAAPTELKWLQIGQPLDQADTDPLTFVEYFAKHFQGDDLSYVSEQITQLQEKNQWSPGARVLVQNDHVMEMTAHYSWASSPEEIKEKYAYLPLIEYGQFIIEAFAQAGTQAHIVDQLSYLQSGYPNHIDGRLDVLSLSNQIEALPDFTGVWIFQKKRIST